MPEDDYNDELDDLCLDCLEEDDFDDLADVDHLLDNNNNHTDAGYTYLAILDRKGHFV